jgi:hypothetical protein
MTFWLETEPEAEHADGRDLSFLCKACSQLDEVCESLGVKPVGAFADEGDSAAELTDLFPELSLEAPDGRQWASILDGIQTFQSLLETLMGNDEVVAPLIGDAIRLARLTDEMEYVLSVLEEVGEGRFCLTLVS